MAMPRLKISRLWTYRWSLEFGYDLMKIRPLESFGNNTAAPMRIYSERRNDLTMAVNYRIDDLQLVSLNFLFGNSFDPPDSSSGSLLLTS